MSNKEYIFKSKVFNFYYSNRFGWFRLFGKGIKWKDKAIHGLRFRERIGVAKFITINNWIIGFLK